MGCSRCARKKQRFFEALDKKIESGELDESEMSPRQLAILKRQHRLRQREIRIAERNKRIERRNKRKKADDDDKKS
jgi:hypothetical protein